MCYYKSRNRFAFFSQPMVTNHIFKTTSLPSLLARHGYLLLLIPPLLVFGLGYLLFEISATASLTTIIQSFQSMIHPPVEADLSVQLAEARARFIWLATLILNIVVPLYAISLCSVTLYHSLSPRRLLLVSLVGFALASLGLIMLAHGAKTENALYRLVFGFAFLSLQKSGRFDPQFLQHIHASVSSLNVLTLLAPVFAVLAGCATLAPCGDTKQKFTLSHIEQKVRHLKGVLNAGSALLVAGILHMGAWLRWPISLVPDPHMQEAMVGFTLGITIYWGATFTLLLITTYGPAVGYLSTKARQLVQREVEAGRVQDPKLWLKEHGLSNSLGEQLPQIGVMLAPLLAGPLSSTLVSTVGPLAQ